MKVLQSWRKASIACRWIQAPANKEFEASRKDLSPRDQRCYQSWRISPGRGSNQNCLVCGELSLLESNSLPRTSVVVYAPQPVMETSVLRHGSTISCTSAVSAHKYYLHLIFRSLTSVHMLALHIFVLSGEAASSQEATNRFSDQKSISYGCKK